MAEYKYNSYEVFNPVKRFLPSLLEWLTQFHTPAERETALLIVRELLFLSRKEILELSHVTYQKILHRILDEVIAVRNLEPFDYTHAFRRLKRFVKSKCIFIAMSDGAQIDYFRRHGNEIIENDQVLTYYKMDSDEIRKFSQAKYAFLIDDISASGLTFLRKNKKQPTMEGQLARFVQSWGRYVNFKAIYYCPYVVTEKGLQRLQRMIRRPRLTRIPGAGKFEFDIIYGMCIPRNYSILEQDNELFKDKERLRVVQLCENYYDPRVESPATEKGGNCKFGFGKVGIFLVRYNNTPNNTPSLLWFTSGHRKALFRRLVRHRK